MLKDVSKKSGFLYRSIDAWNLVWERTKENKSGYGDATTQY